MFTSANNILVVAAHPDDEVLGVGGTIKRLSAGGGKVWVLYFTDGDFPEAGIHRETQKEVREVSNILGFSGYIIKDYPVLELDQVPLWKLALEIENCITTWQIDTVFTHHYGDVNQDHRRLYEATLVAIRPQNAAKSIRRVYCYEALVCSEWGKAPDNFSPNVFVDITNWLPYKHQAMQFYKGQLKKYPHPRSQQNIDFQARYRGAIVGGKYSEAFELVREVL